MTERQDLWSCIMSNRLARKAIWLWPAGALLVVAGVAVAVLTIVWTPRPEPDTGELELLKVCLQVLGIGVLGAVVTYATFTLQQDRVDRSRDAADRRADGDENRRRDIDRIVDARRRRDHLTRELLDETLSAYLEVKRIRRLVEAEVNTSTGPRLSLEVYDRYLPALNRQQLVFEVLKRRAPLVEHWLGTSLAFGSQSVRPISLRSRFKYVESYLNRIVNEYQSNRYRLAEEGPLPLEELGELYDFIERTETFRDRSSAHILVIQRTLEAALLEPLDLPHV